MEWVAKNPTAFITIIVLIIGNVWSLAVSLEQARRTKMETEELRKKLDEHLAAQSLHRTADSEARITRIESGINAVGAILTDMKENIGLLRGANHKNN